MKCPSDCCFYLGMFDQSLGLSAKKKNCSHNVSDVELHCSATPSKHFSPVRPPPQQDSGRHPRHLGRTQRHGLSFLLPAGVSEYLTLHRLVRRVVVWCSRWSCGAARAVATEPQLFQRSPGKGFVTCPTNIDYISRHQLCNRLLLRLQAS